MSTRIPLFFRQFANVLMTAANQHFSGRLEIRVGDVCWNIFFHFGRILWVDGGVHPLRRWRRSFKRYLSNCDADAIAATLTRQELWAYRTFRVALQQPEATREQVHAAIVDNAMETTFDILQALEKSSLDCVYHAQDGPTQSLALLKVNTVFGQALRQWEAWQDTDLGDYSPNLAPRLVSIERLRELVSPKAATRVAQMARGDRSLRDLAVLLERDLLRLSRSLTGGVRQGALQLSPIEDSSPPQFANPNDAQRAGAATNSAPIASQPPIGVHESGDETVLHDVDEMSDDRTVAPVSDASEQLTIVHVDDSPQNCGIARAILEAEGYRYVDVNDPLLAISTMMKAKPQLVLLDLMMPVINGYELCSQIRRVSSLQSLPVVMLTSQDGLVDRMRAKMVKATAFLTKPIDPLKLSRTVKQLAPIPKKTPE